jgi:phenylacetate-CoA ligase
MTPFTAAAEPVVENQIFDPAETMPRDQLAALQAERLRRTIERAGGLPFYRKVLAEAGITANDIRTIEDVRRLPVTTKIDLRDGYPLAFCAVDRAEVARFHGSSGTTGKPTFVPYTRDDLAHWSQCCARFLVAGGLRPEHVCQIAFGYGMFTGAFGLHQGIERVGAAVIPVSSGNTPRQIMIMCDLKPDVIICTPSYACTLAEGAAEAGVNPRTLPIRFGHFGGEPWTEDMRECLEVGLGIRAFNNYGLSEVMGPGVSGECAYRCGMHLQEDHFLVECVNPDTLEPVAEREPGELIITTLTRQAMPMIRYRTRDICTVTREPCACGRTTMRMSRVIGRSDDMLIIKGVNVFPSQVEEALLRVEGTAPHYLIEVDRPASMDVAKVKVEIRPEDFSDELKQMQNLHDRIEREIASVTGLRMQVELVAPQTLERSGGKANRVIDHRREKGLI